MKSERKSQFFAFGHLNQFFVSQGLIPKKNCWKPQNQTPPKHSKNMKMPRAYQKRSQTILEAPFLGVKVEKNKIHFSKKKQYIFWGAKSLLREKKSF